MSSSDQKGKKPSNAYSEKEQWEDDLDLPPIAHQKAKIKKPILEKAEFDKKRKTNLKPFIAIGSLLLMIGIYFLIICPLAPLSLNTSLNTSTYFF